MKSMVYLSYNGATWCSSVVVIARVVTHSS